MSHISQISQIPHIAEELIARRAISADDVPRLRRELWKDGILDREEARLVFELDHACRERASEWLQFYVDALTEYFVWKAKPRRHVGEEAARFLMDNILRDHRVSGTTELELLINVVHWCESCPEPLALFALSAVKDSVLAPETAVYGSNRAPAVIGAGDVEIVRKVIHAPGSPGGITVTRAEAELMFELNNATVHEENASGWQDLFVKAIANYLMFPRGAPALPDAEESLRRERWLAERRGVGNLFKAIGESAYRLDIPFAEVWESIDPTGAKAARRERVREDARVREALAREAIDEDEAKWLIGQIRADRTLNPAERALLAFIKENATSIHPILRDFMEKAGE